MILVDSSVWIDYFHQSTLDHVELLEDFIKRQLVVTNDVILAEITPKLLHKGEEKAVRVLRLYREKPLNTDWAQIVDLKKKSIRLGLQGIGILDLMIAQHAIQHRYTVLTADRHFRQIATFTSLDLYI